MKKTTLLRKLLKEPGVLIVPTAYDTLSARIIETVGLKAIFMPPSMTSDVQLGLHNVGLVTASEVAMCAKYMADSVNIPLIVGADDGYGGALAAYRTTEEIIRGGAAAIYISDRTHQLLSRTPHNLVEVLPRDEYLGKMSAVIEARNSLDKDFVVVARIDAGATMGYEEVIARSKACTALGVDIILPHAVPPESRFKRQDKAALKKFYKLLGAPEVLIWGMGPTDFTAKDCADVGAKIWVPNFPPTLSVRKALFDVYKEIRDTGNYVPPETMPNIELSPNLKGKAFWRKLEDKYVP
jgi:methylisocitrate lyase